MAISEGQMAPDFTAQTTDGSTVTLSGLRGKPVVLYFYPKDDTSGCTMEACDFRDNLRRLQAKGVTVLGVSPDSVTKHVKFTEKYSLNFPLVADEGHAIAETYGLWVEKMLYGRKYMGVERTTYVIDEKGVVHKVFPKVKVEGHVDEVARAVEQL